LPILKSSKDPRSFERGTGSAYSANEELPIYKFVNFDFGVNSSFNFPGYTHPIGGGW
jgi:hypothetical protein